MKEQEELREREKKKKDGEAEDRNVDERESGREEGKKIKNRASPTGRYHSKKYSNAEKMCLS